MATRLYFATDIHGSEKSFFKFLNAGKFYKAQVLIMGGDITGKVIVPLVKQSDGYHAVFRGLKRKASNELELQELEKEIRFTGYYPYRTEPEEMAQLENEKAKVDSIFVQQMLETTKKWVQLAEERLRNTGIKIYITGGNDDLPEIEPIIRGSNYVIDPEGEVVDIDSKHEMISSGWSNPTPWKTPRECSEEELLNKIRKYGLTSQGYEERHLQPACSTDKLSIRRMPETRRKPETSLFGDRTHNDEWREYLSSQSYRRTSTTSRPVRPYSRIRRVCEDRADLLRESWKRIQRGNPTRCACGP